MIFFLMKNRYGLIYFDCRVAPSSVNSEIKLSFNNKRDEKRTQKK